MSATRPDPAPAPSLLSRIARGDAAAVGEFYDLHASAVFGLLCRILRDRAEAEDVLQEVFVRVWEHAGSYDPALGSPGAWLARIARNRAIDRLRSRASRPEFSDCTCPEAQATASREVTPDVSASRAETQRVVAAALAALAPEQRHLIEHAYYLGYTQSELAAHFRLPLGTVKTRIRTGMMTLRDYLQSSASTLPGLPSRPM